MSYQRAVGSNPHSPFLCSRLKGRSGRGGTNSYLDFTVGRLSRRLTLYAILHMRFEVWEGYFKLCVRQLVYQSVFAVY